MAAEGHPAAELHLQSELPGDLPGSAHSSLMFLTTHWNRIQQLQQRLGPDINDPGQHINIQKLPSMCRRKSMQSDSLPTSPSRYIEQEPGCACRRM